MEARQIRSVEREARRRRRRERRQRGVATEHDDGTSSDDELLETNRLKFVSDTGETTPTGHTHSHTHYRYRYSKRETKGSIH